MPRGSFVHSPRIRHSQQSPVPLYCTSSESFILSRSHRTTTHLPRSPSLLTYEDSATAGLEGVRVESCPSPVPPFRYRPTYPLLLRRCSTTQDQRERARAKKNGRATILIPDATTRQHRPEHPARRWSPCREGGQPGTLDLSRFFFFFQNISFGLESILFRPPLVLSCRTRLLGSHSRCARRSC